MAKQFQNITTHIRAIALVLVMVVSGTGIAKAAESDVVGVRVVMGDVSTYYQTSEKTVEEFLASENITIEDNDIINVNLDAEVTNAMRIVISKPFEVTLVVDGVEAGTVKTNEATIGKLIVQLKEETGLDYKVVDGQSSGTKLTEDMEIQLLSITNDLSVEIEKIAFEEETVNTDELYVGESRIKQEGVEGVREVTIKTIYVAGEVSDSFAIDRKVVQDPVNKIVEVGTKVKEVAPVVAVPTAPNGAEAKKVITMNASAYCPCAKCCGSYSNGYTANGMKATKGVVAVDTRVIPLGTKLYIEGYGYCVAADRGGAIKGNKIDLCYSSHSQALSFGRKNISVYVLS